MGAHRGSRRRGRPGVGDRRLENVVQAPYAAPHVIGGGISVPWIGGPNRRRFTVERIDSDTHLPRMVHRRWTERCLGHHGVHGSARHRPRCARRTGSFGGRAGLKAVMPARLALARPTWMCGSRCGACPSEWVRPSQHRADDGAEAPFAIAVREGDRRPPAMRVWPSWAGWPTVSRPPHSARALAEAVRVHPNWRTGHQTADGSAPAGTGPGI